MKQNRYVLVSGVFFALLAVLQATRAVLHVPVHVGAQTVPVWFSWVAVVVTGGLCLWAFRSAKG